MNNEAKPYERGELEFYGNTRLHATVEALEQARAELEKMRQETVLAAIDDHRRIEALTKALRDLVDAVSGLRDPHEALAQAEEVLR